MCDENIYVLKNHLQVHYTQYESLHETSNVWMLKFTSSARSFVKTNVSVTRCRNTDTFDVLYVLKYMHNSFCSSELCKRIRYFYSRVCNQNFIKYILVKYLMLNSLSSTTSAACIVVMCLWSIDNLGSFTTFETLFCS